MNPIKRPRILITDLISVLIFFIGYLIIYTLVYISMLNTIGSMNDLMFMLFKIMTILFYAMLILGGVGILIHIMMWIVWYTNTPDWAKKNDG